MDSFEINRINEFLEGTKWTFHPEQDPPVYRLSNPFGDINIEVKGDDLETSYADIFRFRKGYDYRIDSWKDAEKREDGRLRVNNHQAKRLQAKLGAFYDILELEQKLLRMIWAGQFPDDKFDLSSEDIRNLIKIGREQNLEFTTVIRKEEMIHFYISDCYPDVTYMLPIITPNFYSYENRVEDAYDEFDIERELVGCLIEKYGHSDTDTHEADSIRGQLEKVRRDLFAYRFSMNNYRNSLFDE